MPKIKQTGYCLFFPVIFLFIIALFLQYSGIQDINNDSSIMSTMNPPQHGRIEYYHSNPILANSGWIQQNRKPTFNFLGKVHFTDPKTGWITGDCGVIIQTKDGGESWNLRKDISNIKNIGICFIDNRTYLAISEGGKILVTQDSGKTWKVVYHNSLYKFDSIFLSKSKNVVVSGKIDSNIKSYTIRSVILISMDSGKTWKKTYESNRELFFSGVFLPDSICFYWGNSNGLLFSMNGGKSWSIRQLPDNIKASISNYFIDSQVGWITRWNRVYYTKDGGLTWELQGKTEHEHDVCRDIYFIDSLSGFIVGNNLDYGISLLYYTKDGGKTWKRNTRFDHFQALCKIYFKDSQKGWIVGSNGAILHTEDGGKTWNDQTEGFPGSLTGVHFINENTGWAVGGVYAGTRSEKPGILKTDNGGKTWKKQFEGKEFSLKSLFVIDSQKISVMGWGKKDMREIMLYTENGGISWNDKNLKSPLYLFDSFFINDKTGWIIGWTKEKDDFCSRLFYTDDGGENWKKIDYKFDHNMNKIYFADTQKGFVYGYGQKIYETWDGGITWNESNLNNSNIESINGIFFIDSETGWLVAGGRRDKGFAFIFNTKDSGKTWIDKTPPNLETREPQDVFFINSKIGWIAGGMGMILKTKDGGKTWKFQNSTTNNCLNKIFFINENTGWIVGDYGAILHTTTGGE